MKEIYLLSKQIIDEAMAGDLNVNTITAQEYRKLMRKIMDKAQEIMVLSNVRSKDEK